MKMNFFKGKIKFLLYNDIRADDKNKQKTKYSI